MVERDQYFKTTQRQDDAPWGLARISKTKSVVGSSFNFNLTGEGVNVYVVDSGVWESHPEFGKRAKLGYSVFRGRMGYDCAGHGTEVSSIVAGVNVGVAKKANIIVAQVLDCQGQGQNSDILLALDWIVKNGKLPAVINMSVGGPISPSLDEAVKNAISRGFVVVAAAGNAGVDACKMSPSRVNGAIVIGASNDRDERAKFSNYGRCITLFAPGTGILAASIPSKQKKQGNIRGYNFVSGTSLATPFASGVIALLLQRNPKLTPFQIKRTLVAMALRDTLLNFTLLSSPNLLLQAPEAADSSDILVNLFPPGSLPTPESARGLPMNIESPLILGAMIVGAVVVILTALILIIRACCRFHLLRSRGRK